MPEDYDINQKYKEYALTAEDVLNGKHRTEECPSICLSEFSELEYIRLKKGNNLYDRANDMFQESGFEPHIKMNLSQLVTAYRLAAGGMAATFASDRMVRCGDDSLLFYRLNSIHTTRRFYILLPNREYTSRAVKMFIQYTLLHV